MKLIKKLYNDFDRASENKEFYDRYQIFFKGKYAKPNAVVEHMEFDYLPKIVKKLLKIKQR